MRLYACDVCGMVAIERSGSAGWRQPEWPKCNRVSAVHGGYDGALPEAHFCEGVMQLVEPAKPRCVHCGGVGVVDVPIDNEVPQEHDGVLKEIRAWSCVACAHKRVRWEPEDGADV